MLLYLKYKKIFIDNNISLEYEPNTEPGDLSDLIRFLVSSNSNLRCRISSCNSFFSEANFLSRTSIIYYEIYTYYYANIFFSLKRMIYFL